MRKRFGKGIAHEKEIKAMEKEIHHLQKQVHFLMEHHYTHESHPLYGAWGVRGIDWYCGKEI